jgi:hypothetical protein
MRDITPASGIKIKEYLYSTEGKELDSATIDASAVSTVDSDSKKYLNKGVVLARITSPVAASGLVGPYSSTASDGRQSTANIVGINDTFADLSDGDKEVGVLVRGTVNEDQVEFNGSVGPHTELTKGYFRTSGLDILFK